MSHPPVRESTCDVCKYVRGEPVESHQTMWRARVAQSKEAFDRRWYRAQLVGPLNKLLQLDIDKLVDAIVHELGNSGEFGVGQENPIAMHDRDAVLAAAEDLLEWAQRFHSELLMAFGVKQTRRRSPSKNGLKEQ